MASETLLALADLQPLASVVPVVGPVLSSVLTVVFAILETIQDIRDFDTLLDELRRRILDLSTTFSERVVSHLDEKKRDTLSRELNEFEQYLVSARTTLAVVQRKSIRRGPWGKIQRWVFARSRKASLQRLGQELDSRVGDWTAKETAASNDQLRLLYERRVSDSLKDRLKPAEGAFSTDATFDPKPCLQYTRLEIQDVIMKWVESDGSRSGVFCLCGPAGSGKSAIAKSICMTIATRAELSLLCFFAGTASGDSLSTSHVVRTLAFQAARLPGVRRALHGALNEQRADALEALPVKEQFDRLITGPFLDASKLPHRMPRVVIVIDAVNECDPEGDPAQQTAAHSFNGLLQSLDALCKTPNISVRIILTYRPTQAVKTFVVGLQRSTVSAAHHVMQLATPDDRWLARLDIDRLLHHSFETVSQAPNRVSASWADDAQISELANGAQGSFLYATAIVKDFLEPFARRDELMKALLSRRAIPQPALDIKFTELLERALQRFRGLSASNPRAEINFRRVLAFIALAHASLSVECLAGLLQCDLPDAQGVVDKLNAVIIVSDQGELRVFHTALKDFLVDESRCRDPRFLVRTREDNADIAEACLTRLANPPPRATGSESAASLAALARKSQSGATIALLPTFDYAVRHWHAHLSQSQASPELRKAALAFAEQPITDWRILADHLAVTPPETTRSGIVSWYKEALDPESYSIISNSLEGALVDKRHSGPLRTGS